MSQPPHIADTAAIVEVLARHSVRSIVIGGVAGNLHGSATVTQDLDVCYARDRANLEALARALRELEVTLRGAPPGLPFRADEPTLRMGLNFTFDTKYGPLDCLGEATGISRSAVDDLDLHRTIAMQLGRSTYEVLAPNAERMRIGETDVLVASLDDLIRMKRGAGRPQDLIEVERLTALREVREEAAPYIAVARKRAARAPAAPARRNARRTRRVAVPVRRRTRH